MRVLVCGGRWFGVIPKGCPPASMAFYREIAKWEQSALCVALDILHVDHGIEEVIHGAAEGADAIAGIWARRMAIKETPFPANWKAYGRSAGPRRNQRMLDEGKPDLILATPGGAGTADMMARAERAAIKVMKIAGRRYAP